jgi:hypothetical protein
LKGILTPKKSAACLTLLIKGKFSFNFKVFHCCEVLCVLLATVDKLISPISSLKKLGTVYNNFDNK